MYAIIHSFVSGEVHTSDDIWKDTQELVVAPREGTERLRVKEKDYTF